MKNIFSFFQWQKLTLLKQEQLSGLRMVHSLSTVACLALCLGAFGTFSARASDPVGIYALVDKIVFEPNEKSPERIQVWGAFALAEGSGWTYTAAVKGYMYFGLKAGKEEVCKKEWNDLKAVAGTDQIVALGRRYQERGSVRKAEAKVENPDVYPLGFGLTKIDESQRQTDYKPFKELRALRTQKPAEKAGSTTGGTKEKRQPSTPVG